MEYYTGLPNRQRFTMYLGITIVAFHILLTLFIVFIFGFDSREKVHEIVMPITAAYLSGIVKWFFDTRGIVTKTETIGKPLIWVILMVVGGLMIGILGSTIYYQFVNRKMLPSELKEIYLWLEVSFGGMFGIIMSELYGTATR